MLRISKEITKPDRAYIDCSGFHESYLFCSQVDDGLVVAELVPLPEYGYYEIVWKDTEKAFPEDGPSLEKGV